jgi:hypothetical protein
LLRVVPVTNGTAMMELSCGTIVAAAWTVAEQLLRNVFKGAQRLVLAVIEYLDCGLGVTAGSVIPL